VGQHDLFLEIAMAVLFTLPPLVIVVGLLVLWLGERAEERALRVRDFADALRGDWPGTSP
jgi:hypothetical protein